MRRIRSFVISFLFALLALSAAGQRTNQVYWSYIDQYKEVAIDQMKRYRIPASITLAQGLVESGAGRSYLATVANNHFGIKVGGNWTGPYVLRDDDAPNEKFRKYRNARESYEDHSVFLQGKRYQGLFQLSPTDYKGWARGLKAAGYATSPTYAETLINIIEMYNLSQFDHGRKSVTINTQVVATAAKGKSKKAKKTSTIDEPLSAFFQHHRVLMNNGVYFIIVEIGDDMATIARETGLSLKKLYSYNDLPLDYAPTQGDVLYLNKKKKEASRDFRKRPIHIVETNQSIHDIAQLYAIRLDKFYKLNQWDADHTILPGDIIRIR